MHAVISSRSMQLLQPRGSRSQEKIRPRDESHKGERSKCATAKGGDEEQRLASRGAKKGQ